MTTQTQTIQTIRLRLHTSDGPLLFHLAVRVLMPTLSLPHEIHVLADGAAVARHFDSGDVDYPSIDELCRAHGLDIGELRCALEAAGDLVLA